MDLEARVPFGERTVEELHELLRSARAHGDVRWQVATYALLIHIHLDSATPSAGIGLYLEARHRQMDRMLPRALRMRVADELAAGDWVEVAAPIYAALCSDGLHDELSVRAAVACAELAARRGDPTTARTLYTAVRESSSAPPDVVQRIEGALAGLQA
jgi:hypothetical protein